VLIKPVTAEVLVSAIMRALGKTSGPARQGPPGASARAL
jgi:hypothetical protein